MYISIYICTYLFTISPVVARKLKTQQLNRIFQQLYDLRPTIFPPQVMLFWSSCDCNNGKVSKYLNNCSLAGNCFPANFVFFQFSFEMCNESERYRFEMKF